MIVFIGVDRKIVISIIIVVVGIEVFVSFWVFFVLGENWDVVFCGSDFFWFVMCSFYSFL